MALEDHLTSWRGIVYRHLPTDAPISVLDFRYAGRSNENRWNVPGEPTLYLASDVSVAIAEYGRHFQRDRAPIAAPEVISRRVLRLDVWIDRLLDLRDAELQRALSLSNYPECFLDRAAARATAQYLRRLTTAQALLVPSVAMLDRPDLWNLILFLDKLPVEPHEFIRSVTTVGTLQWSLEAG